MACRRIPLYQVDAFTSCAFGGNPAAVCLLSDEVGLLDDATRQAIAAENNLSETAFLEREASEAGPTGPDAFKLGCHFRLRWFTPTEEVPLCGHATLASASTLYTDVGNTNDVLSFHTLSGVLTVRKLATPPGVANTSPPTATGDNAVPVPSFLEMSLPHLAPVDVPPAGLDLSTDGALACAFAGGLPVEEVKYVGKSIQYVIVALASKVDRCQLEAIQPDHTAAKQAAPSGMVRGVIVTAHGGNSGYDILSRFFAPWVGVNEDPVTGSAHSVLAPYWAARLGKVELSARQCSKRGGELFLREEAGAQRVLVSGQAVTVLTGTLFA